MLTPQEITCSLFCRGGGCVDVGLGRLRRPPLESHNPSWATQASPPLHQSPNAFAKIYYRSTSARVNATTVTNIR